MFMLAAWLAAGEPETLTGEWGGARPWLAQHGVTVDAAYTAEGFVDAPKLAGTLLGHVDLAVTLDTAGLGLWDGGKLYALAQNNHGTGINTIVGSAAPISNLEAEPYTQLTELFFEQNIADVVRVRVGKQDANREFGTPRFGGNFINNNFGMLPTVPLPSYPTTGLGALAAVDASWLTLKAGVFERDPVQSDFGWSTTIFRPGAGYSAVAAVDARHTIGGTKNGGTTSIGVWHQGGPDNDGVFLQNDERIYADPKSADSAAGITCIIRAAFARPDRNDVTRYAGGSLAWHGLAGRDDDTIGLGIGWFALGPEHAGAPAASEFFVETFYKARFTSWFSLEPDIEYLLHPSGTGPDALLAGVRAKVKL